MTSAGRSDSSAGRGPGPSQRRTRNVAGLVALAVTVLAVAALLVGLVAGGGAPQPPIAGLPDAGAGTGWGLPVAKLGLDLAGVGTVGALLAGVVLAPGKDGALSSTGYRLVLSASWWAVGWANLAVVTWMLQMSDFIGAPLGQVLDPLIVANYTRSIPESRALLLVAVLACVVAVGARFSLRASSGTLLLIAAVAGLLPPAFTGHSAGSANHDIATSSLVVHVLAASIWVGGLVGVLLYLRRSSGLLAVAVPRYSALALACFAAVAFSGVVNVWTRLAAPSQLWATSYGALVLGKVALLVVLGWFGWWHRRRTVPAVLARRPRAFVSFAAAELAFMAAAFGLAVALSRSPAPVPDELDLSGVSRAEAILGYEVPPVTAARLALEWRLDAVVLTVAALALALYVVGVRRLRARQIAWSPWRTALFTGGVAVVVVVMNSGMATYAMAMFSVHMAQHMALTMLAPVLLALGAPITLALRALSAAGRDRPHGPREWLVAALHSRPARVLAHPLVALTLYITSLYGLYFTPLFELAMRSHSAHLLMAAHFLAVGMLFFWPILGVDPAPRRLTYPARLLLLGGSLPLHAFFGIALLGGNWLIAADWYQALALPGVDPLTDQRLAGGIAWAAGELPSILVLLAVLPQWFRADERTARRADRRADADGDAARHAYNRHLATLAREEPGR